MDWAYPMKQMLAQAPEGIDDVLARLGLDPPPAGSTMLFDPAEMMQATRAVEEAVADGDRLLVGFQTRQKLEAERARYEHLARRAHVIAFGRTTDEHDAEPIPGVEWIETGENRRSLENQWFLVLSGQQSFAFVGYEISHPDTIARGGALDPERTFSGFLSEDPRVVTSLEEHLDEVAVATPAPLQISSIVLERFGGARRILVATGDRGVSMYQRARRLGFALAAQIGASVILYDRSAESSLVDPYPYPEVIGPEATLDRAKAYKLQRPYLADQIDDGTTYGVETSAWLPRKRGPAAMTEAVRRFEPDLVILPGEITRPSLRERIAGNTIEKFRDAARIPILLAMPEGALVPGDLATAETGAS